MKFNFWELKKDASELLRGKYNKLVMTIFIPFLIYIIILMKNSVISGDVLFSFKGILLIILSQFIVTVGTVALACGIKDTDDNKKISVSANYLNTFAKIHKILPSFFLGVAFPLLSVLCMLPEISGILYDNFFIAFTDYNIYFYIILSLGNCLPLIYIYLSVSLVFVPFILAGQGHISGWGAVAQSFRLTRRRNWSILLFFIIYGIFYILGSFVLVIGGLWIQVYFNALIFIYYKKLREKNDSEITTGGEEDGRN